MAMTDLRFYVPVIAHRLFGTRLVAPRPERRDHRSEWADVRPLFRGEPPPGLREARLPVIDRGHGTTMKSDQIRAIFDSDSSLGDGHGYSVNDAFEPLGIRFLLVAIVDDMIPSHVADFVPRDTRFFENHMVQVVARAGNRRRAVHLLIARGLEGRNGEGRQRSDVDGWALLPDPHRFRGDGTEAVIAWRHYIHVIAHEFGHVLKLPHAPGDRNIMSVTADERADPSDWTAPQMRVMQWEAGNNYPMLARPEVAELAPEDWARSALEELRGLI